MSYTPAANEYPITNSTPITAGWPSTTAAYLRVSAQQLSPGVFANVNAVLLDANGAPIKGANFHQTVSLAGATALNSALYTAIQGLAAGYSVNI